MIGKEDEDSAGSEALLEDGFPNAFARDLGLAHVLSEVEAGGLEGGDEATADWTAAKNREPSANTRRMLPQT